MSPSVRDLKGNVIAEDAPPVHRVPAPPDPPVVLTGAALEAKRRVEMRTPAERAEMAEAVVTPLSGPPARFALPTDLEAALTEVDRTLAVLAAEVGAMRDAVEAVRDAVHAVRYRATKDAEIVATVAKLRDVLG